MTRITLHYFNNFKSSYQKLQQIGILLLCIALVTPTSAQTFTEQTGTNNPFNGVDVGALSSIAFVDIDNDGDFDAFIGENNGNVNYYKNTGTNVAPIFTEKTGGANPLNSVNLSALSAPTFVDIDNDGDFDAFIGESDGTVNYYKNIGSNTNPNFAARTGSNNPFDGVDVGLNANPVFVDLDNDGDFDAFLGRNNGRINYYKNTGTNTNAILTQQTGSDNPLNGIDVGDQSAPTIVDIDQDGDFDVFIGEFLGFINYYKNTGTNTNPNFVVKTGNNNPLNGADPGTRSTPTFVDINNDGEVDFFTGEEIGNINYWLNTTALPVELTYFKGEATVEGNLLTWQTASEENNEGFEVQRSMTGEEWETIDFVVGNGTTLEVQDYVFTDGDLTYFENLQGLYYRLKQMDFDGQFEYSDIINITMESLNRQNIKFFPNPVKEQLTIEGVTGRLSIYNLLGQPIYRTTLIKSNTQIPMTDFPSGQYFVEVLSDDGQSVTKRIVKQ